jgi:hypothetical protein
MLASFLGVLPILTPPLCARAFIMCSESNPLAVFALDLIGPHILMLPGTKSYSTGSTQPSTATLEEGEKMLA